MTVYFFGNNTLWQINQEPVPMSDNPTELLTPFDASALPRFKCHKVVRAARITAITAPSDGDQTILDLEGQAAVVLAPQEWVRKHSPEVGGYYVVYEDGYTSFSPEEAFEDGYTIIE